MYTTPKSYQANGKLKVCDRCGFEFRWKDLRQQNGLWLDRECLDNYDSRLTRATGFRVEDTVFNPTFSITYPTTGSILAAGLSTNIYASASGANVNRVVFYVTDPLDETTTVGVSLRAQYVSGQGIVWGVPWTVPTTGGVYTLYAVALDILDNEATSTEILVTSLVEYTGITFNGLNAYFSNNSAQSNLNPGTGSTVIEWDQRVNTPFDSQGMVIATGADEELGGIDIWWQSQFLKANIYYLDEDLLVVPLSGNLNSLINDGITHRFSLVCNRGGDAQFYVDGVASGTPVSMATLSGKNIICQKVWIGNNGGDPTHFRIHGTIYGINWMNGTTTPTAITSPLTKLARTSYSVGYWPMSELSGSISDTVHSITLSANGSPTYDVDGP